MSSSNFSSTQKIPQIANQYYKLTKVTAGYMEIQQFKDADTKMGYFCNNCHYFIEQNHCLIVTDEGQDIDCNISGGILPYATCAVWTPKENKGS